MTGVRLVIAECSVDYSGRLSAHLPKARRLLLVKADGSVLVHSDGGSYKPLNWMSPPAVTTEPPLLGVPISSGRCEGIFHGPFLRAVPNGRSHRVWPVRMSMAVIPP